jgi:hypothetical protein
MKTLLLATLALFVIVFFVSMVFVYVMICLNAYDSGKKRGQEFIDSLKHDEQV